jgi:hypothetical protein
MPREERRKKRAIQLAERKRQKRERKSGPDVGLRPIGVFSFTFSEIEKSVKEDFLKSNNFRKSIFGKREEEISDEIEKSSLSIGELKQPEDIPLREIDDYFGNDEREKAEETEDQLQVSTTKRKELKVISRPNASTILNALSENICTVDFVRITQPRIERIMRCSVNDTFVPNHVDGLGPIGNRIIVWDLEKRDYRSFYVNRVIQISYEEDVE